MRKRGRASPSRATSASRSRDFATNESIAHFRIDLLFSQVALGEHAEAVRTADAMRAGPDFKSPWAQSLLYRLACIYSLSVAAVEEARAPQPLTEADGELQAQYRDKALTALEQSHASGNTDFEGTRLDADLIPIRGDPRFQQILEREKKSK